MYHLTIATGKGGKYSYYKCTHRINVSNYNLPAVLEGEIDLFIDELIIEKTQALHNRGVQNVKQANMFGENKTEQKNIFEEEKRVFEETTISDDDLDGAVLIDLLHWTNCVSLRTVSVVVDAKVAFGI